MSYPLRVEPRFPFADGALTDSQRAAMGSLVKELVEDLTPTAVHGRLPHLRELLERATSTPEEFDGAYRFIGRFVWWAPAIGYWLSYILQLITREKGNVSHPLACSLYADAQATFADDRSLSSLEIGYVSYQRIAEAVGGSPDPAIERMLADRMRTHHLFYGRFLQQIAYPELDPLVDNLHNVLSWHQLRAVFPEVRGVPPQQQRDVLEKIATMGDPDVIFHRVIARKSLGLASCAERDWAAAVKDLRQALTDARGVSLVGEIGHLRRILGHALRRGGDAEAAAEQFETALREERPVELFAYWRSLSAHELGDARNTVQARYQAIVGDAAALAPALEAYNIGRNLLDIALVDDPLPAGRAAKQQCARSYANNAVDAARVTGRTEELIAEIEAGGPRGTAEALAEMLVVGEDPDGFARDREIAMRHVATVPEAFDEYLRALPDDYTARLRYQRKRGELSSRLGTQFSTPTAKRALKMRIPGSAVLLFFVGWSQTVLVLLPLDGSEPDCVDAAVGEQDLRAIDESFRSSVAPDGPPNQGLRVRSALDGLIAAYEERFGPALEQLLPRFSGKQLKILPREQMVRAPLHALNVGGMPLIDHCDISYGVSLQLLLQQHGAAADPGQPRPTLVYDPRSGPLLGALGNALARSCASTFTDLGNPTWPELEQATRDLDGADLVFACKGVYDPARPSASRLNFGEPDGVSTASILAGLKPGRLASVTMAACESGVARAEISAEYLGLPSAFLSAGVPHVVGTLWQVNKLAAAMVVARYFELRANKVPPVRALNDVVRKLRSTTREEAAAWIDAHLPEQAPLYRPAVQQFDEHPFEHPEAWAAFSILGDF